MRYSIIFLISSFSLLSWTRAFCPVRIAFPKLHQHFSFTAQDAQALEDLQNELFLIEAIEARNQAQKLSFVDEKAQWDAQDEYERALLLRKPAIEQEIHLLRIKNESKDKPNFIKPS